MPAVPGDTTFWSAILWGAVLVLANIYAGDPVLAVALARLRPDPVRKGPSTPTVTVVIASYNEEKPIARKIRNVLALDYPEGLVDVIVASDASADGTDAIVRCLCAPHVRLLRVEGRLGKTACQNAAAAAATGDILLFTDATTEVSAQALRA